MDFLHKILLPFAAILVFSGCDEQEVLLSSLTVDGGVYYHEGKPYTGIGFSNWAPDVRKKTIAFKNGEVRKIARYYRSQGKPMDSLLFDENRGLIYEKRWVNDTLFVERNRAELNFWEKRFNPLANLGDSITPIQDKHKFTGRQLKPSENLDFNQWLDSVRLHLPYDHTFILNSLGPVFGPNNDQPRTFPDMLHALGDLHFTGAGSPGIDGQYKHPDDLYVHPLYGREANIDGVIIDLYCEDDRGVDWNQAGAKSKKTLHRMRVYTGGWNRTHPEYYDWVANNFCIVDSLAPNYFRIFLRSGVDSEIDIIEDEYRPLIMVLEMDFNPSKISELRARGYPCCFAGSDKRRERRSTLNPFDISVYALGPSVLFDHRMTLAVDGGSFTNKNGGKSKFDKAFDKESTIKRNLNYYLQEEGVPYLKRYFDLISPKSVSESVVGNDSVSTNNSDEKTGGAPGFWIVVMEGKTNVNVRSEAPAGEVIGTVNGGDRILASKTIQLSEPQYLLKKEMSVTSIDGERRFKRAASYQLYSVELFEQYVTADIKDDNNESVRVRVPIGDVDVKEQDVWYYLPELDGYIFGGLVRRDTGK